jgi:hypothetical protein
VVVAAALLLAPAGQSRRASVNPTFTISSRMSDLHVTIGDRVNETYCLPKPKSVGTFCGGISVKPPLHQQNPRGGHPQFAERPGPYWFHQSGALLGMTGLTVRSNGLLLGTVRGGSAYFEDHVAHTYRIQICVSDAHIIPQPGQSSTTCRSAKITIAKKPVVKPKPPPVTNFSGTWQGHYEGATGSEGCAYQVAGPVVLHIEQSGKNIFGTVTFTNLTVLHNADCTETGRSSETYAIDANVDRLTATSDSDSDLPFTLTMDFDNPNHFMGSVPTGSQGDYVDFNATRG